MLWARFVCEIMLWMRFVCDCQKHPFSILDKWYTLNLAALFCSPYVTVHPGVLLETHAIIMHQVKPLCVSIARVLIVPEHLTGLIILIDNSFKVIEPVIDSDLETNVARAICRTQCLTSLTHWCTNAELLNSTIDSVPVSLLRALGSNCCWY